MTLAHHYADKLAELVAPVAPVMLKNQQLKLVNHALASQLNLPDSWWRNNNITKLLANPESLLAGHAVAQKYGGHQFGHWNPYLGDGRGLLLGEAMNQEQAPVDLHLKGAGATPYSRGADGRAVLRSTLREYIGSEALHHLGIPTSRGLCLFTSDEIVYREQPESGAMMIRTAPSHLRFGHFEYFYHAGEKDKLSALFDFTLDAHFPQCREAKNPYKALLSAITLRTARMIAYWQAYGFVHGVMNSDNMSIHGITFDYGPYAFIDTFKPDAVFNHSDQQGRYAFDKQPGIGLWNLNVLAHAFSDYCTIEELKQCLAQYEPAFIEQYHQLMFRRLGLSGECNEHGKLANEWQDLLAAEQRDYNFLFRQLSLADINSVTSPLRDEFINRERFETWWQAYRTRRCDSMATVSMKQVNPAVIARTHLLQQAIDLAHDNDMSYAEELLNALTSPFDDQWDGHAFSQPPATQNDVSLSCSS